MLSGELERKLRRISRGKVRIYCGDNENHPAGVYFVEKGEFIEICGIDKNWIPEHRQTYLDGRIKKGGWRRVLKILIQRKLVDRRYAEKVFGTHLAFAPFDAVKMQADPIAQRLKQAEQRSMEKILSKTGTYMPGAMDVQEMLDYRDYKKELKKQGEIL